MDDEPIVPFRGVCDNCNKHIDGEVLKTVDTECLERYFCSMDCFCEYFDAEWVEVAKYRRKGTGNGNESK